MCLQECAKNWVAITAGTLLCCIYFKHEQPRVSNNGPRKLKLTPDGR